MSLFCHIWPNSCFKRAKDRYLKIFKLKAIIRSVVGLCAFWLSEALTLMSLIQTTGWELFGKDFLVFYKSSVL